MSSSGKAKAKAKARRRTAGGCSDGGGGSVFSAVALLRKHREEEAMLTAEEKARSAKVKRMDAELTGQLHQEERREAVLAKQTAFKRAVHAMTVESAEALLAGKTLDDLDAYAGPYHRQQRAAARQNGKSALTALELAPYRNYLSDPVSHFVLSRADAQAREAAKANTANTAIYRRVFFLFSRSATDAIQLECLRNMQQQQRPDLGLTQTALPPAPRLTLSARDIRSYLQHV